MITNKRVKIDHKKVVATSGRKTQNPLYKDSGLQSRDVAEWVHPQHRAPFIMLVSLYGSPRHQVDDFSLQGQYTTKRVGVWKNKDQKFFVAFKGTSIAGDTGKADLYDDAVIAGLVNIENRDITLVTEGDALIKKLLAQGIQKSQILLGGHSLGGFAAMTLATRYQLFACVFNAAAPPTRPVLTGPGPIFATHYHICGDVISSHMSDNAALVIRADKRNGYFFAGAWPHATDRFFAIDPTYGFMTASQEDLLYVAFAALITKVVGVIPLPGGPLTSFLVDTAINKPIPGSSRNPGATDAYSQYVNLGQTVYNILQVGNAISSTVQNVETVAQALPKIYEFLGIPNGTQSAALDTATSTISYEPAAIADTIPTSEELIFSEATALQNAIQDSLAHTTGQFAETAMDYVPTYEIGEPLVSYETATAAAAPEYLQASADFVAGVTEEVPSILTQIAEQFPDLVSTMIQNQPVWTGMAEAQAAIEASNTYGQGVIAGLEDLSTIRSLTALEQTQLEFSLANPAASAADFNAYVEALANTGTDAAASGADASTIAASTGANATAGGVEATAAEVGATTAATTTEVAATAEAAAVGTEAAGVSAGVAAAEEVAAGAAIVSGAEIGAVSATEAGIVAGEVTAETVIEVILEFLPFLFL